MLTTGILFIFYNLLVYMANLLPIGSLPDVVFSTMSWIFSTIGVIGNWVPLETILWLLVTIASVELVLFPIILFLWVWKNKF